MMMKMKSVSSRPRVIIPISPINIPDREKAVKQEPSSEGELCVRTYRLFNESMSLPISILYGKKV